MDEDFTVNQKEEWQQERGHIEQRRSDMLPDHEKTQKMYQKLQSLQDKLLQF